jgi:hypothetical protein
VRTSTFRPPSEGRRTGVAPRGDRAGGVERAGGVSRGAGADRAGGGGAGRDDGGRVD